MPATETLTAIKANLLLNNGESASGAVKTINLSLGTLNPNAWDPDKALAIIDALENVLARSVYSVNSIKTYFVSN